MVFPGGLSARKAGTNRPSTELMLAMFCILCFVFIWWTVDATDATESVAQIDLQPPDLSVLPTAENTPDAAVDGKPAEPPPPTTPPTTPPANSSVAVIIETKLVPNLIPLMLHFSTVLGPSWLVVLYTLEASWTEPASAPFRRAIKNKSIEVRFLPPETILNNSKSVSTFLTKPWLWTQLQSTDRMLLFQSDSVICSKANTTVEDFFAYDFVGAPIDAKYGQGYNGGLSIRNPELFLQIVQESDFSKGTVEFEDQWFYIEAKARVGKGVNLPGPDIAMTFAVETIDYETPLGYHQPARWQADNMAQIEEYCPEVKMLIGRRAT